jgi:uncharacterized membrane protein HdeD (DUF308 family)
MALDVRYVFALGVIAFAITRFYLEKHYETREIFWMYSALSTVLGLLAAYTVAADHPSRIYYIPLTVVSIVLAILYYQTDENPSPEPG